MKKSELDLRGQTTGQIKTFCPLCYHTRKKASEPSLQANLDTGGWKCWNCNQTGYLEDVPRSQFAAKPRKEYKVPDQAKLKRERPDPEVLAYFQGRGISEATLVAWDISAGPSFSIPDPENPRFSLKIDGVPQYARGIQFPFFERGQLVWMKYLRPREWNEDGNRQIRAFAEGKPIPFGLDRAGGRLVLVEGEVDALSVYEAGIHEVWSLPNGAKNLNWLDFDSVVEKLQVAGDIYLAVDDDADGRACRDELIRRLSTLVGAERLSLVQWPAGCKDANDVLKAHGPARLKELIEAESVPVPIDGITEVHEFVDDYLSFYDNGLPKGIPTGIPGLDSIYRVMPGFMTILTGVTNYGKSELMDEIIRCMNEQQGWKFGLYTPENHPASLHMIKLSEKYIGKPFDKAKPGAMTRDEALLAAEWMQENLFYINPTSQPFSVDEIIKKAKVLVYRKGIQGLVIDPWNYVRKDFGTLREDQFINAEIQKLLTFARSSGVHIWLTVHPRTLRKNKETNKIEVPQVMDLSGGSKFGDNADFILAVHRDPQMAFETGIHEVDIHCEKSRYRYAAIQGKFTLVWDPSNGRFSDAPPPRKPPSGPSKGQARPTGAPPQGAQAYSF